jgi:hypothetical protein
MASRDQADFHKKSFRQKLGRTAKLELDDGRQHDRAGGGFHLGTYPVRLTPVFDIDLTAPGTRAEDAEKTAVFHYSNVKTVLFPRFSAWKTFRLNVTL